MKNIKIALLIAIIPCLFLALLMACSKENAKKPVAEQKAATNKSLNYTVTMSCKGSCDNSSASCSLQGTLGTTSTVSCACSGCFMEIITTKSGVTTVTTEPSYEMMYLEYFLDFMHEDYTGSSYELTKAEVIAGNGHLAEVYYFTLQNGTTGSVMYVDEINGMKKEVKQIDCTGTCDCREEYNMNTGMASCSCANCTMSITIIKS